MRKNVLEYYDSNLSPKNFKIKFQKMLSEKKQKIVCCDDHRSVGTISKQ